MSTNPLRAAIKALQEKGWIRGKIKSPNGYCSVGAIRQAQLATGEEFEALHLLAKQIRKQYRPGVGECDCSWCVVTNYNDHRAVDADEVIGQFKLAAEEWDLRHAE